MGIALHVGCPHNGCSGQVMALRFDDRVSSGTPSVSSLSARGIVSERPVFSSLM